MALTTAPKKTNKEKEPEYDTDWTDEMIERFLTATQRDGDENDPDFDAAIYAFRFLPGWVFPRYVKMFVDSGKNLNAKNVKGETILQYFKKYPRATEFVEEWEAAGGLS